MDREPFYWLRITTRISGKRKLFFIAQLISELVQYSRRRKSHVILRLY
jgi:hypothetical protein